MASRPARSDSSPPRVGGCLEGTAVQCQRLPVRCSSARCRFWLVRSCSAWSFELGYRWKKHSCLVEGGTRCPLGRADRWCLPALSNAALCRNTTHSQGRTLLWTDTAEESILIKVTLQTWCQNTDIKCINALPSRSECAAASLVRLCSLALKTIGQERTGL